MATQLRDRIERCWKRYDNGIEKVWDFLHLVILVPIAIVLIIIPAAAFAIGTYQLAIWLMR